jgi:hypothetical protein
MTWFERLFGPAEITPADAARVLCAARRRADRERIAEMTARLKAGVAAGQVAKLGWKA